MAKPIPKKPVPSAPPKIRLVKAGCPACSASGYAGGEHQNYTAPFCKKCNGTATVLLVPDDAANCAQCDGRGHRENIPCFACAHTGRVLAVEPAGGEPGRTADPNAQTIGSLQKQVADLTAALSESREIIRQLQKSTKSTPSTESAAPEGAPRS